MQAARWESLALRAPISPMDIPLSTYSVLHRVIGLIKLDRVQVSQSGHWLSVSILDIQIWLRNALSPSVMQCVVRRHEPV